MRAVKTQEGRSTDDAAQRSEARLSTDDAAVRKQEGLGTDDAATPKPEVPSTNDAAECTSKRKTQTLTNTQTTRHSVHRCAQTLNP